jgi:RNA polymerase sigma-70 factor, ECF subfamily
LVPTRQTGDQVRMAEHELADLIRWHRDPLYRYVLRRTFGDRQLAEDITQEALLRAWQRSGTVDWSIRDMRPWLFAVARNLVVDNYRAMRARPAEVLDERMNDRPEHVDRIAEALVAHDMTAALARLSEAHRAVLVEVYYHGHSLAEVAVKFGLPLGTVKSRMYYALRALRPLVRELGAAMRACDEVAPDECGRELAYTA